MPNAAERITDTTVKAINLVLFTLNCINSPIDVLNHPKIFIIFNNVSLYGDNYDPMTVD